MNIQTEHINTKNRLHNVALTLEPRICLLCNLGLIGYPEAIELQHRLVRERFEEKIGDVLLMLEHPSTITLGKHARPENILLASHTLKEKGIAVYASDRGGDVTLHCPGQLIIHPVMDLRDHPGGLHGYINDLEETALRVVQSYGIQAERWNEHPGLWVDGRQLAAIGLRFSHGISMHGLALNVNADLASFSAVNLCGLPGKTATSIAGESANKDVSMLEVRQRMAEAFSYIFQVELVPVSRKQLEGENIGTEAAAVV